MEQLICYEKVADIHRVTYNALPECTGLRVKELTSFSCFGFLSTGGFTGWRLPHAMTSLATRIERHGPRGLWRFAALKVFIVAEAVTTGTKT
jgi:hypothetical protein